MASVDAIRVSLNGIKELDFSGLPVEKLVQIRCGIYKANCRLQPNLTSEIPLEYNFPQTPNPICQQ
jgi:hypothetical protein